MENELNIICDRFYKVEEIAGIFRLSTQSITRDIRQGRLKAFKLGDKTYRIVGSHIIEYLNNCRLGEKK
jgi:hypothetical protein